jgi:hypothetical protein
MVLDCDHVMHFNYFHEMDTHIYWFINFRHLTYFPLYTMAPNLKGECIMWTCGIKPHWYKGQTLGVFLFAKDVNQWKFAIMFLIMFFSFVHYGHKYCDPICSKSYNNFPRILFPDQELKLEI